MSGARRRSFLARRWLSTLGACLAALIASGWAVTAWQAAAIARRFPPLGAFVRYGDDGPARLHYTERRPAGPERGIVLVLHGASGNQADLMVPLGDRLAAEGFRVIAVDRPGLGWSDRPDGEADASPSRQAALIRGALARVGVTHAIVLGHSWSGALAAAFALDAPEFTRGLVLLAPVLYPWPTGIAWYYAPAASPVFGPLFTRVFTLPAGLGLLPAGIAEVFAPQPPPADYAERTGVALVLRPDTFLNNAQDVFHLHAFVTEQSRRLATIAVPTAIVTGEGDRVVSPTIHSLAAARDIPGATLTLLPGVGHSPQWSAPDAVVAAVRDVAARAALRAEASPRGD